MSADDRDPPSVAELLVWPALAAFALTLAEVLALYGWARLGWDPYVAAGVGAAAGVGSLLGLACALPTMALAFAATLMAVLVVAMLASAAWAAWRQG